MSESTVSWPWRGAHLAVLWAFAVVQPLLDLLGSNAEFFVARGNGAADVIVFSLALVLLPPLVLLGLELLAGLASARLAWMLHLAFTALLAAAFALQVLDGALDARAGILLIGAVILGLAITLAYVRSDAVRSLFNYLSPAPALFLALFLLTSDASRIVLPQDEVQALGAEGAGDTPVVVVLLDELPTGSLTDGRGGIDEERFPSFAALAREATWYSNATTVATHTDDAVPAMLSGTKPDSSLDPLAANYPNNLFTLFAGEKPMNVQERTARLCPESFCESRAGSFAGRMRALVSDLSVVSGHLLLPGSLASDLPPVNEGFSGFAGAEGGGEDEMPHIGLDEGAVDDFLAGIEREPRAVHFIHLTLPHHPWRYLPNGQNYGRGGLWREWEDEDERWLPDNRWVTLQAQRAHLLQTGFTDSILGRVMHRLRAAGAWDDALFVVLADHGVSFTPGTPRRYSEEGNIGEIAPTPLFIKEPGQTRGRVDERHVTNLDLLPTIADILGVDVPYEVDGRPASEVQPAEELTILRGDEDEPRIFDLDQALDGRDRAEARLIRLFGHGWSGVWRMGPNPELIGRRAASMPGLAPDPDASFALAGAEQFEEVDPEAEFLPALVSGRVTGIAPGTPLAVAVNGRIAAVAEAYHSIEGSDHAALMAPPSSFRPGSNRIELFEVLARGRDLALRPVPRP